MSYSDEYLKQYEKHHAKRWRYVRLAAVYVLLPAATVLLARWLFTLLVPDDLKGGFVDRSVYELILQAGKAVVTFLVLCTYAVIYYMRHLFRKPEESTAE